MLCQVVSPTTAANKLQFPLASAEDEKTRSVVLLLGGAHFLPGWRKKFLFPWSVPNESSWEGCRCSDVPNTDVYSKSAVVAD